MKAFGTTEQVVFCVRTEQATANGSAHDTAEAIKEAHANGQIDEHELRNAHKFISSIVLR